MRKLVIAIDGYAGCGKSTTAKAVAAKLGYQYIDTGAMYRAVTLYVLRNGIDPTDEQAVTDALARIEVYFQPNQAATGQDTYLNGENVEKEIRNAQVTQNVSQVSKIKAVRTKLVDKQQQLGAAGGVVMDGRDIGTVVFPDADVKLFMNADIGARAERRLSDYRKRDNRLITYEEVCGLLRERDRLDTTRQESPLRKADDAIELNTTDLEFEDQVAQVLGIVEEKAKAAAY